MRFYLTGFSTIENSLVNKHCILKHFCHLHSILQSTYTNPKDAAFRPHWCWPRLSECHWLNSFLSQIQTQLCLAHNCLLRAGHGCPTQVTLFCALVTSWCFPVLLSASGNPASWGKSLLTNKPVAYGQLWKEGNWWHTACSSRVTDVMGRAKANLEMAYTHSHTAGYLPFLLTIANTWIAKRNWK